MSKAEEVWSWIAEDRHLADVDDENSYIDNEEDWPLFEDKVCGDVSHDNDIWLCIDGNLR